MENILQLWHGGRDLEHSYREFKAPSKNNWEYGPGLYLTTHYETARKYAKGGGKTYLISFELGKTLENTIININDVNHFISQYVIGNKQKILLKDIYDNMKRMNQSSTIHAEHFLNLIINHNAVVGKKIQNLNAFLVDNGIDYSIVKRYGGRDETIVVLFNLKKITKVQSLKASSIALIDYELTINFDNSPQSTLKI